MIKLLLISKKGFCNSIFHRFFFLSAFFLISNTGYSQKAELPWLNKIISPDKLKEIHTISSEADVSVSDGLTYKTKTLFHDHQRAVFQQIYSDRTITRAIEGMYVWEFDGKQEKEAKPFFRNFIHGHQFFAKILFFNQIHPNLEPPQKSTFHDSKCKVISSKGEQETWKFYYVENDYPLGMEMIIADGETISFQFLAWQKINDINLPHKIVIIHGKRVFDYNYTSITFNKASINDFRAPENLLTDEQKLLRLHRNIMDDHLFERTEQMSKAMGDSMKIVSAGEIYAVTKKQSTERLNIIMSNRYYTLYDDMVMPVVKVSEDGTLGWVIVQVLAKGVRLDENKKATGPLEFTCAWIELYQKNNGKWLNLGNVSNFKPEKK